MLANLAQSVDKALVEPRLGDFDVVINDARETISQTELPQKYKNFFESYLIRSIVLIDFDLSREELRLS